VHAGRADFELRQIGIYRIWFPARITPRNRNRSSVSMVL
jgi:hypothetical protein